MSNNQDYYKFGLIESIMLGITFTALQAVEYAFAPFSMADNVYGSLFFMCTGFHGFHVIIGTIFLMVQLDNAYEWNGKASANRHFGFEAAS
jgi:cytochrome c oxidase subunit 3